MEKTSVCGGTGTHARHHAPLDLMGLLVADVDLGFVMANVLGFQNIRSSASR